MICQSTLSSMRLVVFLLFSAALFNKHQPFYKSIIIINVARNEPRVIIQGQPLLSNVFYRKGFINNSMTQKGALYRTLV